LAVNAAFVTMMGCSYEDATRMTALDFTAPEYHELVMEKIRSGDEQPYETIDVRKDGSRFPAEVRGRNMPYQGRMVRVIAVRDITERKQAERVLRESEQRLSLIFDMVGDVIFLLAVEPEDCFRFIAMNRTGLSVTG